MISIPRPSRLAALALVLPALCGCQEGNEKHFADKPGSAPAGASVDGEVQPKLKKNSRGEYINE